MKVVQRADKIPADEDEDAEATNIAKGAAATYNYTNDH